MATCFAYIRLWDNMGRPDLEDSPVEYNGMRIELHPYRDYSEKDSLYVQHWKSFTKSRLLQQNKRQRIRSWLRQRWHQAKAIGQRLLHSSAD